MLEWLKLGIALGFLVLAVFLAVQIGKGVRDDLETDLDLGSEAWSPRRW